MGRALPSARSGTFRDPGPGNLVSDRAIRLNLLASTIIVVAVFLPSLVEALLDLRWFFEFRFIEVARVGMTCLVFGLLFLSVPFFVMHMFCSMLGGSRSEVLSWIFVGLAGLLFIGVIFAMVASRLV